MAALLSGTSLEFTNDFKDVLRDGLSTQGAEARQKVLQKTAQVDATVISATDLIKMTVDEDANKLNPIGSSISIMTILIALAISLPVSVKL